MIFHCTLVPGTSLQGTLTQGTHGSGSTPDGSGSTPDGHLIELAVDVPAPCTGADLEAAIALRHGTGELFVRGAPVAAMTVGVAPLVPGAVLIDGALSTNGSGLAGSGVAGTASADGSAARSRPRPGHPKPAMLLLAVHSGPGAGTVVALRRGQFRIGRSGTEIQIPDAALSREHALLDVSDSTVTIVDLGSANGTSVDGRKVRSAPVTTASSIRCGDSTMSLRLGPPTEQNAAAASLTENAGGSVAEPLVVRGTAAPSHRAAVVLAAVLPLLAGIGLALLTGMWMFLAFTAVSAVSVLVPVLSGRRQRRELAAAIAAAVLQDGDRRRQAAPSAADLVLDSAAEASAPRGASRGEPPGIWLRLGLADQRANIRLEPPESGFRPPPLGPAPLTLDPASAVVTIHGPGSAAAGLLRSFILQLAAYPHAGSTCVLLHGAADTLPLAARFLPGVTLSATHAVTAARLAGGPGEGYAHGVLIVWDSPWQARQFSASDGPDVTDEDVADEDAAERAAAGRAAAGTWPTLRHLATAHGWRVIEYLPEQGPDQHPGIVLGRPGALITADAPPLEFIPDLVPPGVFDRFCRKFNAARRTPAALPPAIPHRCGLADVLPLAAGDISRRWARTGPAAGLGVLVGTGSSGAIRIDVKADGPHFLVAGTTGSGKSEFLRTFAAGLAASHPPDRVNLLFIDFKGGSGLGPLTGLPHCVGLLTDLGAPDVERTLVSLRAEVRRREELLARVNAPDLATYESSPGDGPAVPYLIIVVDEFRILVDEAPGALSELMRIAAIGRSLGIHLIMATQRPQGALNADIRANVTTCIALRVQSGLESLDVMGSGLAAAIPIARPGRAFLIRGTQAPEEFQTATMTSGTDAPTDGTVTVRTVTETLTRPQTAGLAADGFPGRQEDSGAAARTAAQVAAPLIDVVAGLWQERGGPLPRRPVADPLPERLPYPGPGHAERDLIRLGLVDLPELQCVRELSWSPARHGHLGLVGAGVGTSDGAGTSDATLALVVDQLLAGNLESHLYVLDATGAFGSVAAAPRSGAVAGLHELRRAARVLQRVAEEVTIRLSVPPASPRPLLVLVLNAWGAWVSAFRSGPLAWAEDLVQDIVRDGPRAGITVVVSGERELVTSRFFAALPNRIFFPAGSTDEGRLAWPRLPALEPLPGRVAVFGAFVPAPGATGHPAQMFEPKAADGRSQVFGAVATKPFRVDALPTLVTVGEVLAGCGAPGGGHRTAPPAPSVRPKSTIAAASAAANRGVDDAVPGTAQVKVPATELLIGVAGDELRPCGVRLPAGGVLAVLGGPASGKSTLLAALPAMNPAGAWLSPQPGIEPGQYWSAVHASALAGTLDRTAIALADDADLLPPEANSNLAALNCLGWRVVLAAGFGPGFGQRVTLAGIARSQGRAVLIRPRGLSDGDMFGVRFEPEQNPPPGRAVVISDGRATPVQLAADRPAGGPVGISPGQGAARDGPLQDSM
jgi:S-DNA-T family DNA segregation ATPase FtsK/SpoIIIE